MKVYDYIITGVGASGLTLAYRMAKSSFFDNKSILIIDIKKKVNNDRTWCYWENGVGEWDDLLQKYWNFICIKGPNYINELQISPYTYKMIRSSDFYNYTWEEIDNKENITFKSDEIISLQDKLDYVLVRGKNTNFLGKKVFNSIILDNEYVLQSKYPVLKQHFLGWFIKTESDSFDDKIATFMDFDIEQKNNTRFMYVLPFSKRKALFEYTLFSENLLDKTEYEQELRTYLKGLGINNYSIIETETGIIPMTSYKFWKKNSDNITHIGTAGGWSKASTGFTFRNITKRTSQIINLLENNQSLSVLKKTKRFWVYDLLLLDVLHRKNVIGSQFFIKLFQRNSFKRILSFLDEETNFFQELRIILSMPPKRFLQAVFFSFFSK